MSPPWVWHVKRTLGMGWCNYEFTAFAVDDDTVVPKYTTFCHPDEAHPEQDWWRLSLALASSGWVCVHLLRPWIVRLIRWLRRR